MHQTEPEFKDGTMPFRDVFERYLAGIRRFLTRILGEDEAEDAAQEVFLRVAGNLDRFRGDSSIQSWIYRIARNVAVDRIRHRPTRCEGVRKYPGHAPEEDLTDAMSLLADEQTSIEKYLINKEMNVCIRKRVDSLPESYRRVLVLSDIEGMTSAEIASVVGASEGAVKIRLHRARARLREDLGTNCAFYRDERGVLACEPKPASMEN